MNLLQFSGFMNAPTKMNAQSIPLLADLVKEYPYFQTGHILLVKNLHNEKDIHYNTQLKLAAAYSTDRKKLFELINNVAVEQTITKPVVIVEKPVESEKKEEAKEITVKQQKESKVEVQTTIEKPDDKIVVEQKREIQPNEMHTFVEWLKITSIHSVKAKEIKRDKKKISKKDDLVDKFLKEEPKISKPQKTEFFSPVNMAKQSLVESDDLVSETLAQIYEKQGFYAKAINAYEKLSLKYPEKKHSFAARIENLTQKLNEQ